MAEQQEIETVELSEAQAKARRSRNIAIALICAGLVIMFYWATIVKFGPALLNRAM